jgi:putative transcriptional regulator
MTEPFASLTNQFLIAMPGLNDPNFTRTVTYLCQHSDEGALGIIVNRPSEITLSEIMTQMGIAVEVQSIGQIPVYVGGPVQPERGFILHEPTGSWGSTLRISESISLTTSRDILEAIGQGKGPRQVFVALGYAGWGKGQLEREIGENSWLNVPASDSIIFVQPAESRWKAAAGLVGVDISALTAPAGHA